MCDIFQAYIGRLFQSVLRKYFSNAFVQNVLVTTPAPTIKAIFIDDKPHIFLIITKKNYENGKSPRKQTITCLCRKLNKLIEFVPLINKVKQQLCNVYSLSNMSRNCVLRLVHWIIYLKASHKAQWITSNEVEYNGKRICYK